jgi:hypothetical protein
MGYHVRQMKPKSKKSIRIARTGRELVVRGKKTTANCSLRNRYTATRSNWSGPPLDGTSPSSNARLGRNFPERHDCRLTGPIEQFVHMGASQKKLRNEGALEEKVVYHFCRCLYVEYVVGRRMARGVYYHLGTGCLGPNDISGGSCVSAK